jgi:hypothetical protein
MDRVMGKCGKMYVIVTLSMRGGRRWQASSIIGVMKSCWKFGKLGVEEFGTLGWKLSFKDCIKRDAIIDMINFQSVWQNIERDQQDKRNASHKIKS